MGLGSKPKGRDKKQKEKWERAEANIARAFMKRGLASISEITNDSGLRRETVYRHLKPLQHELGWPREIHRGLYSWDCEFDAKGRPTDWINAMIWKSLDPNLNPEDLHESHSKLLEFFEYIEKTPIALEAKNNAAYVSNGSRYLRKSLMV